MVRIATFNILHGMVLPSSEEVGAQSADALATAARAIDADVVGLQEVDLNQPRSGQVDQTRVVADALGAEHWRFVPTLTGTPGQRWSPVADDAPDSGGERGPGPAYGIGLVSRLPVSQWRVLRLPTVRIVLPLLVPAANRTHSRIVPVVDEPRAALAAVVEGDSGPFTVITAHLSFVPGVNVRQLRRIVRWARDLPSPTFLVGDMNLPGRLAWRVAGWKPLALQPTYPAPAPRVQFDHLLARGLPAQSLIATRTHALGVSDHRAISADIGLP